MTSHSALQHRAVIGSSAAHYTEIDIMRRVIYLLIVAALSVGTLG